MLPLGDIVRTGTLKKLSNKFKIKMKPLFLIIKMKLKKLKIRDAYIIQTKPNGDDRGFFQRLYCNKLLKDVLKSKIVQINHSFSKTKGTTRGLHYQLAPFSEDKILKCIRGKLVNVIVDLRKKSKNIP